MTTLIPGQGRAEPEMAARPPLRVSRYVTLTAVVALIAGAVGGFFVGRVTAPEKTVTTAAAAYTTGSTVRATVYFDGSRCLYGGPTEVKNGTRILITFTASDKNSILHVIPIRPDTTWEVASATTSPQLPSFALGTTTAAYGTGTLAVDMTTGLRGVVCMSSTANPRAAWATFLRATP
jgi:hypothetical protein